MRRAVLIACVLVPAVCAGAVVLVLGSSGASEPVASSAIPPAVNLSRPPTVSSFHRSTGREALTPATVEVPALEIKALVRPVGADEAGIRLPPVTMAGWYSGGPVPGEPGRTVIVGHRDSETGPAVFSDLPEAKPGQRILLGEAGGSRSSYVVKRVIDISKESFPASLVYSPTRRSTLALITCGGTFDTETGHYEDSVIVLAGRAQRAAARKKSS